MGDFFYYGQKDTIQRLNELAGRGAVVASYAPKVGMSPVGGPNGFMNPAWLDPDNNIRTSKLMCAGPSAKFGYNYVNVGGGPPKWIWIANLPPTSMGANENLTIRGVMNENWASVSTTSFDITIAVRDVLHVEWHMDGPRIEGTRILLYKQADGWYRVYAYFAPNRYGTLAFEVGGVRANTFEVPMEMTVAPDGANVFDTAARDATAPGYIAPRWQAAYVESSWSHTRFSGTLFTGNGTTSTSHIRGGLEQNASISQGFYENLRLGMGGIDNISHPGLIAIGTSAGWGSTDKSGFKLSVRAFDQGSGTFTGDLLAVRGNGQVSMPWLKAGTADVVVNRHNIGVSGVEFSEILFIGREGSPAVCVGIRASSGMGGWGNAASVIYVGKNSTTGRSINAAGTVNTTGNDYAEYIYKDEGCAGIFPGQIVGITAENMITDKWDDALMFSIKSTAPSFVGGDSWAQDIGERPSPAAGPAPTQPVRRVNVVEQQAVPGTDPIAYADVITEPGDTDEEWDAKKAAYFAALTAYDIEVQKDDAVMAAFDAALEAARQKVDRIAIAGRVPVNVLGAQPGDYIVPMQDGAGIKGIAVREDDLTMKQYLQAVGRVISIEPDGRAYVMVKAV